MTDSLCENSLESEDEEHSDSVPETQSSERSPSKPINMSPGAVKLRTWLNKNLKVQMTDGRILIGVFLCTDRDANIILGSCSEYLPPDPNISNEDPRMLGLVMIPGKHIVSMHIDTNEFPSDITHSVSSDSLKEPCNNPSSSDM